MLKTYEHISQTVEDYADAACKHGKGQRFDTSFGYAYATGSLSYMLRRAIEMLPEDARNTMLAELAQDTIRNENAARELV